MEVATFHEQTDKAGLFGSKWILYSIMDNTPRLYPALWWKVICANSKRMIPILGGKEMPSCVNICTLCSDLMMHCSPE